MPELSANPFVERLFEMYDADLDGSITQEEFVKALSYFASLATEEDKYKCALYFLPGSCVDVPLII